MPLRLISAVKTRLQRHSPASPRPRRWPSVDTSEMSWGQSARRPVPKVGLVRYAQHGDDLRGMDDNPGATHTLARNSGATSAATQVLPRVLFVANHPPCRSVPRGAGYLDSPGTRNIAERATSPDLGERGVPDPRESIRRPPPYQ